jgi:hypothetical protein
MKTKPEKPVESLTEELCFQFDNTFHVLATSIRHLSHRQWISGVTPFQTPVRLACHILAPCWHYTGGQADSDWDIIVRTGALDGEIAADNLPGIDQTEKCIEEVKAAIKLWISGIGDDGLLGRCPNWGWRERGTTQLGYIIYLLRHTTLHLGHLQMELHSRGIQGSVFK